MPKRLLIVEAAFHFTRPLNGVMVSPSLTEESLQEYKETPTTAMLVFPDGRRQEVGTRFVQVHYSRRSPELPPWATKCFLEGIESVPAGTEIWIE